MNLVLQGNRYVISVLFVALCAAGMVLGVGIGSAEAISGNCTAVKQKDDVFGPDQYRVRAICSSLSGDAKARGTLDRNNQVDKHTSWFTTRNKYYYSGWDDCLGGTCSAKIDLASV